MTTTDIEGYLGSRGALVERALDRYSSPTALGTPELAEAVRYSLLGGGKRLRPVLVLAGAEACGAAPKAALPVACAFEMVHSYSLIHDDLPAMDDDALRRGRPSSHRVFGEAMAILAGDALLTRAFSVIAGAALPPGRAREATRLLAEAAGAAGMVGGQALDILNGGGQGSGVRGQRKQLLEKIHLMKTAALFAGAAEAGGVVAGAPPARRKSLRAYGRALGLAFQIVDDVLDAAVDGVGGRLTYPSVHGLERSRQEADRLARDAHRALRTFGRAAAPLRALADHVLSRKR